MSAGQDFLDMDKNDFILKYSEDIYEDVALDLEFNFEM